MSKVQEPAVKFSLDWWKGRHEAKDGYFPKMEQHLNWKLYDAMPEWFIEIAKPEKSDVALEVGCGYGQWMAPLAKIVDEVYGFDIHQTLVDKFNEQIVLPNAFMRLGNGVNIPFQVGSFSLVYSISVFQHMPRAIVQNYLHEIKRVLQFDGRALLHFRHDDGMGEYSEDIVVNHTGDWSVGWSLEEVEEACNLAGLQVVQETHGGHSLIVLVHHA